MTTSDYSAFDLIVFPDANVILEGKPLAKLPWRELGEGRTVVLITPTVMKQIDAKKHDGRLGPIAREFRRLVSPLLAGEAVSAGDVAIELAPRRPLRTDIDLDAADSDQRILLEVISCGAPVEKSVFVSGDMQPVADAQQVGLKAYATPLAWLRPPEPSNHERRVQRLEQELSALKQSEPALEVGLSFEAEIDTPLLSVAPWEEELRRRAFHGLIERHERPKSPGRNIGLGFAMLDLSAPDYEEHRKRIAPATIRSMPRWIQEQYGQLAFRLVITNVGSVPAVRVKVDMTISAGWISDRPIWFDIDPSPRSRDPFPSVLDHIGVQRSHYGPHDFVPESAPDRRDVVSWSCEDFRHGDTWTFRGYAYFEPRENDAHELSARITAANFHGECEQTLIHPGPVRVVPLDDLVDVDTGRHRARPPFLDFIVEAVQRDEADLFETIDPQKADG